MAHLSQGMVVDAAIEARLLGLRLLNLEAEITILPAGSASRQIRREFPREAIKPSRREMIGSPVTSHRTSLQRSNGEASGLLAEAARSLASSATELQRARAQLPADR